MNVADDMSPGGAGSRMESRFLNLPPELQTAIISHVLRPRHLAQVCLVSKHLQRIALPFLYRDFSINVSTWPTDELERFLARGHSGHAHIRSIDIDSDDLDGEDLALKTAKDVLQVLPRNCLRAFRCALENGVDNDLIILLAAQQRNLASICLGTLKENALNLVNALEPWPPSVETIIVPWRLLSRRDHDFYRGLIERSGKRLKALTIRVHQFAWHKNGELHAGDCVELAQRLFGHGNGKYDQPPLQLRDINFQNQNLGAFDITWRYYIDMTKLRTIQIWNCYNVDVMLNSLIDLTKSHTLQLEGLVLSFEESSDSPILAERFLRSFGGLRYLNLCFIPESHGHDTFFDIRCLATHSRTLQDLCLSIGTSYPVDPLHMSLWILQRSDLLWLVSQAYNLKQLAIAMPALKVDGALSGKWGQYLEYLELLTALPRLKVLRLLTWPVDCSMKYPVTDQRSIRWTQHISEYLKSVDIIADSIARLFVRLRDAGQDRLSVITFGNAEQRDSVPTLDHGSIGMKKPATYKIRRAESEFGMLLETARMEPSEMQYEEPIAYVYDEDTDQGLSLESYPWGGSSS